MVMLGEPTAPRKDPEHSTQAILVPSHAHAWDGLGGVLGGLLIPMGCAVLLWGRSALPGGRGAAAAAAAGECILPWENEPEAKEMPTPSPSCLPGGVGVGGAEVEGVSFLTEGGGGAEAGDSVSAGLLLLLLPPPLPDPEGLPVEEEELEGLSLMGVPDMRSQMLMGPAQRGVGWTAGLECSTAKGRN
jgi:hypothetical protein